MLFQPFLPCALGAAVLLSAATAFHAHEASPLVAPAQPAPVADTAQAVDTAPLDARSDRPSLMSTVDVELLAADVGAEPGADGAISASVAAPVHLSGDFRLHVPFRTQKDGARFQGANCGPAALAMVLEAHGIVRTNSDLRWEVQGYMGNQGGRGGTALHDIASVGRDFGLAPIGMYDGDRFARWTTQDVEEQLRLGNPVIVLVKYRLLPDHFGSAVRYDHYVVIHGIQGDRFLYHDPSFSTAEDGAGRWISAAQLDNAMRSASIPQQAVAFGSGRYATSLTVLGAIPNVWTPLH